MLRGRKVGIDFVRSCAYRNEDPAAAPALKYWSIKKLKRLRYKNFYCVRKHTYGEILFSKIPNTIILFLNVHVYFTLSIISSYYTFITQHLLMLCDIKHILTFLF